MSFWQEYKDDGLVVVGLSNQPISVIENFVRDQGVTFPVLRDAGSVIYSAYNLPGGQSPYPRDFIIDQNGIIRFADTEYDPGTMITVIESLLGSQPVITDQESPSIPEVLSVSSVYPNPFNSSVTIRVMNGERQAVELEVYNIAGRWVDSIFSGMLDTGSHEFHWSGASRGNQAVSSGIYFVSLRGGNGSRFWQKITLLQ